MAPRIRRPCCPRRDLKLMAEKRHPRAPAPGGLSCGSRSVLFGRSIPTSKHGSLHKRQTSKGPEQDSEGRAEKDGSGKRWETQKLDLGEGRLLAWGEQRQPINLASPGRVQGLWCLVWTLITQILNLLPYYENRFADLKYWAWDSESSSSRKSWEGKAGSWADPMGTSTTPPRPEPPALEVCPVSVAWCET